jgi:hypothetical protein
MAKKQMQIEVEREYRNEPYTPEVRLKKLKAIKKTQLDSCTIEDLLVKKRWIIEQLERFQAGL